MDSIDEGKKMDLNAIATKHSLKVLAMLLFCLGMFTLGVMSSYWVSQIKKYNQTLSQVPPSLLAAPSSQTIERGRQIFNTNCLMCHGKDGVGQDPTKPLGGTYGELYLAPALNSFGHAGVHATSSLFFVAKYGSLTREDSAMRGWEGRLSDDEIASVIHFIRSTWTPQLREAQGKYCNNPMP